MKPKILNALLVLTSLLGYLEWGKDNKQFLFQAEVEIVSKLFTDPTSVIHPLTLLPLAGQLLLLITLFQKSPNKLLTFIGIGGLSLLRGLMLFIGIISLNLKILCSTLPFLVLGFITIQHHLSPSKNHFENTKS